MSPLRRKRPDVDARLAALEQALDLADGRVDASDVALGRDVLERARRRLKLGSDLTVVALAGATGSGKSSLFNALVGEDVSDVGVRRPTTGEAHACVWDGDTGDLLLEWLGVPHRHWLEDDDGDLEGLILLDLPDHDSTEVAHRLEVDRLAELVDLVVWVLDPQKYADAAVHERYLRPLSRRAGVMMVVLNQVDRVDEAAARACARDLRRLLKDDGLTGLRLLLTSARTGEGVDVLRRTLKGRVAAKRAANEKLVADLETLVPFLDPSRGIGLRTKPLPGPEKEALVNALADAAGAPSVRRAARGSYHRAAVLATGWPFARWLRRVKPDPVRRRRPAPRGGGHAPPPPPPGPTPVQRAGVRSALRRFADAAARGLPDPWPSLVRRATSEAEAELPGRLDGVVSGMDLGVGRRPRWWAVVRIVQYGLAVAAIAGLVWLAVLAAVRLVEGRSPSTPELGSLPLAAWLYLGGLGAGVVVALAARRLARVGSERRVRRAEESLRSQIENLAEAHVVKPVREELDVFDALCAALERARSA